MDVEVDIFLPFRWITEHPPQGAWTSDEVRFDHDKCLKQCTKYETNEFSLSWDESVATVILGLSQTGVRWESKVIRLLFDNSQRNNLRSCVWVSVVVFVCLFFLSGEKSQFISLLRFFGRSADLG